MDLHISTQEFDKTKNFKFRSQDRCLFNVPGKITVMLMAAIALFSYRNLLIVTKVHFLATTKRYFYSQLNDSNKIKLKVYEFF